MSRKKSDISKEFADRLLRLMENVGYGGRQNAKFAKKIGVSTSFLSDVINLKSGPSFGLISGITKNFPEININWLLTGKGDLLVRNEARSKTNDQTSAASMIEQQHMDLVKGFLDKQRALNIDKELMELEKLAPEVFERIESYIKGSVDTLKSVIKKDQQSYLDRRSGERREIEDPGRIPDGVDRRSGSDRRKAS